MKNAELEKEAKNQDGLLPESTLKFTSDRLTELEQQNHDLQMKIGDLEKEGHSNKLMELEQQNQNLLRKTAELENEVKKLEIEKAPQIPVESSVKLSELEKQNQGLLKKITVLEKEVKKFEAAP